MNGGRFPHHFVLVLLPLLVVGAERGQAASFSRQALGKLCDRVAAIREDTNGESEISGEVLESRTVVRYRLLPPKFSQSAKRPDVRGKTLGEACHLYVKDGANLDTIRSLVQDLFDDCRQLVDRYVQGETGRQEAAAAKQDQMSNSLGDPNADVQGVLSHAKKDLLNNNIRTYARIQVDSCRRQLKKRNDIMDDFEKSGPRATSNAEPGFGSADALKN